jgi:hypothetical protein
MRRATPPSLSPSSSTASVVSFLTTVCRITGDLEGVNRPVKNLSQTNVSPNRGTAALTPWHCHAQRAALLHLQKRLAHSSKSIQRNLDRVNFLASCRGLDHSSTARSGSKSTHK